MNNSAPKESPLRRRGFTLIELMVVVALIAILATLLVIGVGKLQTNSKRQQTRQTFQTLQAVFAEYDVNRRVPFGAGNLIPSAIPGVSGSLYLQSPQDVTVDNASMNDRWGPAVQYTRYLMAQMMSVPTVASAVGKLPSGQLMTFLGGSLTPSRGPWAAGTVPPYAIYDSVSIPTTDSAGNAITQVFVRTCLNVDSSGYVQPDGLTQTPPNYYYWQPALNVNGSTPPPTPVLLDGWGNPIIFVMGGVFGTPPGSTAVTTGFLYAGSQSLKIQVNSPDYHPFFASAGPDGNFSKGDDNLYSFEK